MGDLIPLRPTKMRQRSGFPYAGLPMRNDALKGSKLNQIPSYSDVLLWLDGTIVTVGSDKYFVDKKNGKNFLITGYDFTDALHGFPYKSAATISAPAGDAALIAADINNFLYDAGGTPNAIPVVSLFQDIDYEHKLFTRHIAQVVDSNGVETTEPHVIEVVLYGNVKSGDNLTKCQMYYGVPEENTTTMAWVSTSGNDTTGNGTKALPYKTLTKVKATTKTVIYVKTGSYVQDAMLTLTGNAVEIIGTGNVIVTTYAGLIGIQNNRDTTYKHIKVVTNASTYGIYSNGGNIILDMIRYSAASDKGYITAGASKSFSASNSAFSGYIIEKGTLTTPQFDTCNLSGNFSVVAAAFQSIKHCKINNVISPSSLVDFIDNTISNNINIAITNCNYNRITGNLSNTITNLIGNSITGNLNNTAITTCTYNTITGNVATTIAIFEHNTVTGTSTIPAVNNLSVKSNTLSYSGDANTLTLTAAANANRTGIEIFNNNITGSRPDRYIVYVGTTSNEEGANSINGLKFLGNKVTNQYVGSGTCHTVFIGGGINNVVKFNRVIASNGYGFVIKSGGITYSTSDIHFGYNVVEATGSLFYGFLVKTALGIRCANNTIFNFLGGSPFGEDTGTTGSALFFNNLVTLSGNASSLTTGDESTSRNNVINKNGHTCTVGVNDFETSVVIDSNGVPASKIEHAESVAGDNNTGLASDYSIPVAITYQAQGGTWQNGAVILN